MTWKGWCLISRVSTLHEGECDRCRSESLRMVMPLQSLESFLWLFACCNVGN